MFSVFSLLLSIIKIDVEWFQASGAVVTIGGVIFAERKIIRLGIEEFVRDEQTIDGGNFIPTPEEKESQKQFENDINSYLRLIESTKKGVSIPVIASINCISDAKWTSYAKKIEAAGADGLELNIAVLPSDPNKESRENEKIYFDITREITKELKIPVAIKLSSYFSGLAKTVTSLSWTDIKALVLFNRFYSPDIDIEHEEIKSSFVFSNPADIALPLRWIACFCP